METVHKRNGAATFGVVGPGVYYVRFSGELSAQVGSRHVAHLREALASTQELQYFVDASELTGHDVVARSELVRTILASRRRFSQIVVLGGSEGVAAGTRAIVSAIGGAIVLLDDYADFERRLLTAAPAAGPLLSAR